MYYGTTLIEVLQAIVSDEVNRPTVVSISWARSEYNYSAAEVQTMNLLIYQADLLGIKLVAAAADHGAYDNLSFPNVSLPAATPLVLGCGGPIATIADGALAPKRSGTSWGATWPWVGVQRAVPPPLLPAVGRVPLSLPAQHHARGCPTWPPMLAP